MADRTGVEFWQIIIIYDSVNAPLLVTVPKNCYTEELFNNLRKHPRAPSIDDFQLYSISGESRRDLSCNMTERLSDYGISHRSAVVIVARLHGWTASRDLLPLPGFIETTTSEPDMLGLDEEGTVLAKMPCGHVIGPKSMAKYCQNAVSRGQFKFYCPSVDEVGKENCNREWDYFLVRHVACLSPDELNVFEKKIADNYLDRSKGNQICPGCGIWCFKEQDTGNYVNCPICHKTFCWACMKDWIGASDGESCGNLDCDGRDSRARILARCPTKPIESCLTCPMIRACPKCGMLTEHKDACGHVTCPMCSYGFCFICLKGMKNKRDWRCSADGSGPTCILAPRQTN